MRALRILPLLTVPLILGSCVHVGDVALEKAVLSYDRATARLDRQMLLKNIGRRDAGLPIHFTVAGQIAASFDWDVSLDATTQFLHPGFNHDSTTLGLRASGRERPTFQIFPVTGSDFAYRFLTPTNEMFVTLAAFQTGRLDQALRLLGRGIELQKPDGSFERFVANLPQRRSEYEEYRRIVLHLQGLASQWNLFLRSLVFDDPIVVRDAPPQEFELTQAYGSGRRWRQQEDGRWALTRRTGGRVVIMNVDPETLSHAERAEIQDRIEESPPSFLYVDIRPGGPGGDYPIHGMIALRGLSQIIDFVAAGIEKHPEFDVQPATATGPIDVNPVHTLRIVKGGGSGGPIESVDVAGHRYSVADTKWDRAGFRMLTWLLQASMGDIQSPTLPITIAK